MQVALHVLMWRAVHDLPLGENSCKQHSLSPWLRFQLLAIAQPSLVVVKVMGAPAMAAAHYWFRHRGLSRRAVEVQFA